MTTLGGAGGSVRGREGGTAQLSFHSLTSSCKGGFLKKMKDPAYQQNQESLKETGGHLIWTLGKTKMNQGHMSKRLA